MSRKFVGQERYANGAVCFTAAIPSTAERRKTADSPASDRLLGSPQRAARR